jgi:hypothetical protein
MRKAILTTAGLSAPTSMNPAVHAWRKESFSSSPEIDDQPLP